MMCNPPRVAAWSAAATSMGNVGSSIWARIQFSTVCGTGSWNPSSAPGKLTVVWRSLLKVSMGANDGKFETTQVIWAVRIVILPAF